MNDNNLNIAICDDSPIILRSIKAMLDDIYKVRITISGKQLLEMLEKIKPDIIILDYEMPEMDGSEIIRLLREKEEFTETPVIFLTGTLNEEIKAKVEGYKPLGYLAKPVTKELLVEMIERGRTI